MPFNIFPTGFFNSCSLVGQSIFAVLIGGGFTSGAVSSIPYIGWLAGGWALLLGQQAGSELGSQVGEVFNDC